MSASLVSLASLLDRYESVTPQVRVAAVIMRQGQVLVVEHRKRGQRYWVLPGGRLEAGESLSEALTRELREELGLSARIGRLLALYETLSPDRHVVNLAFSVEVGAAAPAIDSADPVLAGWQWMDLEALGRVDFRPPIAPVLSELASEGFQGPVRVMGNTWTRADR